MSVSTPASDFELPPGIERRWHLLPDGAKLEVLSSAADTAAAQALAPNAPPLLFVHGAWHGAWCWAEHFMPFFAAAGFECHAVSLRGHGGSDVTPPGVPPGPAAGTLQSHCDDLQSFIATLPQPPVLVVHSFGGMLATKYVSQVGGQGGKPALAGVVLLSVGPPGGMGGKLWYLMRKSPWRLLKMVWLEARGAHRRSSAAARFLLFSKALPEEEVERYRAKLATAPTLPPISPWALRAPENRVPPAAPASGWQQLAPTCVLVGYGSEDVMVDGESARDLAEYYGGAEVVAWEGVGHDVMLDARWREVAHALRHWLSCLPALR